MTNKLSVLKPWRLRNFYPTALLFAQEVYFDNRLTGNAKWSLFDILNSVAMCSAKFI